jgi:hypothetical protein
MNVALLVRTASFSRPQIGREGALGGLRALRPVLNLPA